MPGLADLIFSERADEELNLDDPELARELAELQARRNKIQEADQQPVTLAATALQAPTESTSQKLQVRQEVKTQKEAPGQEPGSARNKVRTLHTRSLADVILDPASGDVEHELEAMEQELERNLQEYHKQRGRSAAHESVKAAAPGDTNLGTTAAKSGETAQATKDLLKDAPDPSAVGNVGAVELDKESMPAELVELRTQVAMMEEAFPFSAGEDADKLEAARRSKERKIRPSRMANRSTDRESAPIESHISEMATALDDLDVKLRSIQNRHTSLSAPLYDSSPSTSDSMMHGRKAMERMVAQNKHLRERMQAGPAGLLNLDTSLFTTEQAT